MSRIKDILNKNSSIILYAVFLVTFLIRLQEFSVFRDLNSDKARQLHCAYSYLHGKGMNFESYDLNTYQPMFRANIEWPPMYDYLTIAVSKITGQDLYQSSVTLDYVNLFAVWLCFLWLFSLIGLTTLQQVLFFCLIGLSKTPLQGIWSSDMMGVTLFLLSCCLAIRYVKRRDDNLTTTLWFFVWQFLIMASMMLLKYSLMPAMGAVVCAVLLYYYNAKKKIYLKDGVLLGIVGIAAIAMLFLYNHSVSGNATPVEDRYGKVVDNSLHFENLSYFCPFIINAIFYLDTFSNRLGSALVNYVSLAFTLIILAVIVFTIVRRILSKKASFFEYLTLTTSVCTTLFFVALSLKFPKDPQGIYFWTYVKEYRYFAPAIFLIIVYLFKTYGAFEKGMRRHILTYMLFFAIVWATGLKLYYTYIGNKAASFENMYGRIFTVADHVNKLADKDTYFVSYTGDVVFDTQVTSIVAIKDIKVAMSYYGYFPDSTFKTPFMAKQISAGKKIIVYLDHNRQMLDSVNAMNSHVVDTMADGGTFLVIKN